MPLGRVTVHTAVPLVTVRGDDWVEGDTDVADPVEGTPFSVLLQLPNASPEENVPRGRRVIVQPQILYEPFDVKGGVIELSAADEVKVTAPELPGHAQPVTYQVEGDPIPMAKPGITIGFLARLKRVKD